MYVNVHIVNFHTHTDTRTPMHLEYCSSQPNSTHFHTLIFPHTVSDQNEHQRNTKQNKKQTQTQIQKQTHTQTQTTTQILA